MSKEFSKKFYKSKEWQRVRNYIFNKHYGLCKDCGKPGEEVHHIIYLTPDNISDPYITLNEDNLVLLCKNCHRARHNGNRSSVRDGLIFNEYGELVNG